MRNPKAKILAIGIVSVLVFGRFPVAADLEVSASVSIHATADFQAPLAPHGTWVEIGSHGRCWRPAHVAVEWRPYCEGNWVWTDCGWYWASDEPWGWACYHYGTWYHDPVHSWVWVPGVEWAPAWVSWRYGGGYCGWAPLAPHGVVLAPALFVFVEDRRFHEPIRSRTVIVNNTTIINQTKVINNVSRETRTFEGAAPQRVVVNNGPGIDPIQKAAGKSIAAVPIRQAVSRTPAPPAMARPSKVSPGNDAGERATPGKSAPAPGPPEKAVPEKTVPDKPAPGKPVPAPAPVPEKTVPDKPAPDKPPRPEPAPQPNDPVPRPEKPNPPGKEQVVPVPTPPPGRPTAPPGKHQPRPKEKKGPKDPV